MCHKRTPGTTLNNPARHSGVLKGRNRKEDPRNASRTNVHGDALCFLVIARSLLQRLAVGGWRRLVAVGSGWWLAVGGWRGLEVGSWRLVAVGGWRWLVAGGWRLVVPEGCP